MMKVKVAWGGWRFWWTCCWDWSHVSLSCGGVWWSRCSGELSTESLLVLCNLLLM